MLVFLGVALLGLIALFAFGRAGQPEPTVTGEAPARADSPLGEDVVLTGEGFDFAVTAGEKTLFAVSAERTLSDREGNVYLEGVEMTLPREGGTWLIRGNEARVNRETSEAQVEGDVVVTAPNEVELETDWLQLRNNGNLLVASRGSRFRYSDLVVGQSDKLRMHVEEELLVLDGGVELESTDEVETPFSLSARLVRFSKPQQLLRAEGDVEVYRGFDQLAAQRITVRLDELLREVRTLRAVWRVRGVFTPPVEEGPSPGRTAFSGWGMLAVFESETQELQSLELEGRPQRPAILISRDEAGLERELHGKMVTASFSNGLLREADALGPMLLTERQLLPGSDGRVLRHAEATSGQALFDSEGTLVRLELRGEVRLVDSRVEATGEAANLEFTGQPSAMAGNPVNIVAEQGRMQAPRVHYTESTGLLHAMEGVRTVLERGFEGTATALASEGPVRVQSQEAFLRSEPEEEFIFRGEVRAWQGRNLLLADQLRGNQTTRQLAASGSVKSLWFPEQEADAAEPIEETPSEAPPTPEDAEGEVALDDAPIEITSEYMSYTEEVGNLLYEGGVVVVQAGRRLSCDKLQVDLTEEREAEVMRCTGSARLFDPIQSTTIDGDWALYRVQEQEVEFHGDPVTVQDAERTIRGPEFLYRLEDGFFRMGTGSTMPGETGS